MGLFDASMSTGGSAQRASNFNQGQTQATSASYSSTDAAAARAWSAQQATLAFERQKQLNQMEMDFNREEAEKARNWEQSNIDTANQMANTVYTRSAADMKAAGINPILAYSMGLGGAGSGSVTSGQGASIGGSSAPMAQSFMDTNSASSMQSTGYNYGEGQSSGSSWQNSESGLSTFLTTMGTWVNGMIDAIKSSKEVDSAMDFLIDKFGQSSEEQKRQGSSDQKEKQKEDNKKENGSDNPFKKGTYGYGMYELQQSFYNNK